MTGKRSISFTIKALISIFLLLYLFKKVGWAEVWEVIIEADLLFLTFYVFLGLLGTLVSAMKWSVLSRARGISTSLFKLFLLYMLGYFFNQILPTSVGGDVIRGYELRKLGANKSDAMASVFMERFTGISTLIPLALFGVFIDQRFLTDIRTAAPIAVAFLGYLLVIWLVFNRSFLLFVERRASIRILAKFIKKVRDVQESIYMYKHNKLDLVYAIGYSVVFYFIAILIVYVGCLTFAVSVPLTSLSVAVPVMLILFMIPISLGGIGLQEWVFYFVLGMIGVPSAVGLTLGLLYRARAIGFGLLGGAIYPFISSNRLINSRERFAQSI